MTASLLTASRARDARACRRRHHLRYGLGYRPVQDAKALRFGTLVHAGLEAWFLACQAGQPVEAWLDAALQALAGHEADAVDMARAQVMLTGYHLRWHAEPFEVLAVEVPFEGPLRNPVTGAASRNWRLAGKLDAVIRRTDTGQVWIVEHKTSGEDVSPGSDYWRRLRMDGQVSTYFEGARILGYDVAGCIYDVLAKPKHKPSEAKTRAAPESVEEFKERLAGVVSEAPEKYFARGEVVRLEAEMEGHLTDTWQLAQQLREEELAGRFPRNPDACMQPGRTCPYWAACTGEASLDDPQAFTRSDEVHPELAAQPAVSSKEESPWQPQQQ